MHNKRGDVVQRADAQGGVIRSYRYTAFGVELDKDDANTNPWRFASMYWDAEKGTYYTPNRRFSPRFGRWTSSDPYWNIHNMQFGTNPVTRNGRLMPDSWAILQASNLYMFVMHNPVRFLDPLGLNAILLTDTGRNFNRPNTEANTFGHTALAIQRDTGNWYIMDFRAVDGSSKFGNEKATIIFSRIYSSEFTDDGRAITGGHFFYGTGDNRQRLYINRYNRQLFIEGDFQASWDMANRMSGTNPGFHFTNNNCVWRAINVLQASTVGTSAHNRLEQILWVPASICGTFDRRKATIIPNLAVGQVQRAMRNDFVTSVWTAPLERRSIQYIFN